MSNRHHVTILHIEGAEVERVSDRGGKSYFCRECAADRCRHIKLAREADALHIAQSEARKKS